MNPIANPYTPSAGSRPPKLTGRDDLLATIDVATQRIRAGRQAKSVLLVGLHGVGKTVLLDQMRDQAETRGMYTLRVDAPKGRSLPGLLAPQFHQVLLRISRIEQAKEHGQRALRALAGFTNTLKAKFEDIDASIDFEPEPGLADNGDLENDLQALLEEAGRTAKAAGTALIMFMDDLQCVEDEQLASLITALHRATQQQTPVMLIGAGLPHLPGKMGRTRSYAERQFDFPVVGPLDPEAAKQALVVPASDLGVAFDNDAIAKILSEAEGYPYLLQEWGKHVWDMARVSPISLNDVLAASIAATTALDENFFRASFDQMKPSEKRYLRAMAELGPGTHHFAAVASELGRKVAATAPTRNQLLSKGMIWNPNHSGIAFTAPQFDAFMRRMMPGDGWREA